MPSYDVSNFPIAIPAIGTLLQVGNGASPELFSSVANIGDITGPTTQVAVVDVTSHTSPAAPYRQKVPTLIDPGTLTIPVYIVPASGAPSPYGPGQYMGHDYASGLGALLVNRGLSPGVPYNWKIVYPDGLNTTDSFGAFPTKYTRDMKVAGVISGSLELTLTGKPNFA